MAAETEAGPAQDVNEVRLTGRVAAEPTTATLPSGDEVVQWRLVVGRGPADRGPSGRGPTVDTIDCSAWTSRLRSRAARLPAQTEVEVTGALRRRFWRSPAGPASRYEVEVTSLRRISPTARA